MNRAAAIVVVSVVLPLSLLGCEKKPSKLDEMVASAKAPPPPPPEPAKPAAPRIPDLVVDPQGPLLGGERVEVSKNDWFEKLEAKVRELPVEGKAVQVVADRQAKTQHVAGLVGALGAAGATEVTVKTQARVGGESALSLTPERVVAKTTPDCAAIGMIRKDSSSAVWQIKGGTARKFSRGFAGPDLSMTFDEGLSKRIAGCSATTWFFAGEEDVIWGLSFDLAEKVTKADPKTKATSTVLVSKAPVAGRPVKLSVDP